MKICFPTMGARGIDEELGEHFGRVPTYTIVDTETGDAKVVDNTSEHGGGSGYPPEIIKATGADIMVVSGLGRRAIMMFEEYGIMVYVGASGSVRDALAMYKAGRLEAATDKNACAQHAFRGERHGDGCEH